MRHAALIAAKFEEFTKELFEVEPNNLYEPVRYIMNLDGKRIRPMLVLYACELFGGDINKALKAAYGVELFHNFTLVHDDIMDNSDLRRGMPAVHTKYGLNAGILSGDLMMIKSIELASQNNDEMDLTMFQVISRTSVEVYEGQQMDVDFEELTNVAEADYIEMIRLKTAVLLGCSLNLGAIIAGASMTDQKAIKEFGDNIGIAFQIQDDYLDSYGSAKVGKKIGGDILNNKKTLLQINANKMANDIDSAALVKWWQTREDSDLKIKEVKEIFERSGAKKATYDTMISYYDKAVSNLNQIQASEELKQPLFEIAEAIVTRSK